MLIVALILRVGDDHLRMLCTEDCNQAIHRLVVRSDREAVGVEVGVAVRHARISVAEHVNDVVADDRGGSIEFLSADLLKVVDDLRTVHRRVENVAFLARCSTPAPCEPPQPGISRWCRLPSTPRRRDGRAR